MQVLGVCQGLLIVQIDVHVQGVQLWAKCCKDRFLHAAMRSERRCAQLPTHTVCLHMQMQICLSSHYQLQFN